MEHKDSSGCRRCPNSRRVHYFPRSRPRRAARTPTLKQDRTRPPTPTVPSSRPGIRRRPNPPSSPRPRIHTDHPTQTHPTKTLDLRPNHLQTTKRSRAAHPPPQRLPAYLRPLRQNRHHVRSLHQLRPQPRPPTKCEHALAADQPGRLAGPCVARRGGRRDRADDASGEERPSCRGRANYRRFGHGDA